MYKILKNIIEMDDYSVQKLSKSQPPEPFEWNTVEGIELNVDDCIGGKGKIGVKGNTYQKQLSGKNKFGVSERSEVVADVDCLFKDSEILINGAQTTGRSSTKLTFKDILPAGTYHIKPKVISGTCVNGSGGHALSIVITDTNNTKLVDKWLDDLDMDFTLSEANQLKFSIWIPAGAQFNNYKVGIQIEEGSTATDYEPYCGGKPSPNPDYQQEIKVVTGNNVVKHFGKNLFDCSATLVASGSGLTNSIDSEGYIVTNGQATANWAYICRPQDITEFLKDGETYTLWAEKYKQSDEVTYPRAYIQIRRTKTDGTQNTVFSSTKKISFTVDKSTYSKYEINVQTGNEKYNYDNYKNRFMLLKGDYTNKEVVYEPYREEEYRLDLIGKNIFDYTKESNYINSGNSSLSKIENGIRITTNSSGINRFASINLGDIEKFAGKSFTVSYIANSSAQNTSGFRIYYLNESKQLTDMVTSFQNSGGTFTVPSNPPATAKYIALVLYANVSGTATPEDYIDYTNIQVEQGAYATEYSPYYSIELCKIGNYSDIPFKNVVGDENYNASLENDTYYKLKKVGKYVFDGTENISLQNNGNRIYKILHYSPTSLSTTALYVPSNTGSRLSVSVHQ